MAEQKKTEIRYLTAPSIDTKKKKYCRFKKSGIKYIDYKDGEFLKKFGFASIKDLPDITEFDDIEEYDEETPHEQLSINFEGDADSEDK